VVIFLVALAALYLLPLAWWLSSAVRRSASIPVGVSLWQAWVPTEFRFFQNVADAFRLYPMHRFFINSIIVATVVTSRGRPRRMVARIPPISASPCSRSGVGALSRFQTTLSSGSGNGPGFPLEVHVPAPSSS
jgi:hypothetical protein